MNRRLHMLLGGLFALSPLTIAMAQETATKAEETEEVERIQVTGSNIRGVDLEGSQPLQIIGAEEIAKSGANSIFELLQNIGQTRGGSGTFDTAQSGGTSNSTPAGQAAASLRGMGPSSTLTLINGRRVAPSSFAAGTENFVDINSIPLAAIERIEVLATGASAIYGADAVAGVINYILKKDYEGAEVNLSFEDSTAGSDESRKGINIVWGGEVGGGNLTLFADLFDQNAFAAADRDFTANPLLQSNYSYLPKLPYSNVYFNSSNIQNDDGDYLELANPNCPVPLTNTEIPGEEICAYYSNQDDLLNSELESQSIGAIYNYEFGDIQWSTDFFFSRTKSVALSTPAAINRVDDREGPYTLVSSLDIFTDEQLEAWQGTPFIDDFIFVQRFDTQAGQRPWGFRYDARFQDPRTVENETQSFRLVSSLAGEFDTGWQWEAGVTFSQSESEQVATSGIYNRYKFNAAAHGELCSDGSIANYDSDADVLNCASGNLLAAFNPFLVGNAENDAILDVAQERPTRDGKSTVFGFDARINGELMEFGDDYIRAAFGIEYRQEDLEDIPSMNARANFDNGFLVDVFGFGSSVAEADRTQFGAFAEFHIPLSEQIDLQLAGRFDDYDDFGSTFNPKVGFSYRPVDELILRGSWATSFRAPSLTQAGVDLRTTQSTFDCAANQAVADLYCEGDGFERNVNSLEVGNRNLQAEESDSISFGFAWSPTDDTTVTVDYWAFEHERIVDTNMTGVLDRAITDDSLRHCGLVPAGSIGISYDDLVCSQDYADAIINSNGDRVLVNANGVEITDANGDFLDGFSEDDINFVQVTDANGNLIHEAGADLSQILDRFIVLNQPRDLSIPLFRDHIIPLENTGTQDVSGIDFRLAQDFDLWGGTFSIDADLTHYLSFERNRPGSDQIQEEIGRFRFPENIGNLSFFWGNDDYSGGVFIRYVDGYEDDMEGFRSRNIDELLSLGVIADEDDVIEVSSWTTVDANFTMFFEDATLRFNVDNVFDRDPPQVYGARRGFDTINHNALGTTFRISYTHFFE